jgi:hypothetical protein
MNKLMKFIPAKIIFRSFYWVKKEQQMKYELNVIFDFIDNNKYDKAEKLCGEFRKKWDGEKMPMWVYETYVKITNAETQIHFLKH